MTWLSDPSAWAALATLTLMEVVLGIDNVVFISILAGKLPAAQRAKARRAGLGLAMGMRLLLLLSLTWMMKLTEPLFSVFQHAISGRDLILIGGGLFLIAKSTHEIHNRLEGDEEAARKGAAVSFASVLAQIAVLDVVFSLDSVITAIGMADKIGVMMTAVVAAVLFMMVFAGPVSDFVHDHPTVKMLALSFLLLIGVTLLADGLGAHVPKGYVYFAMGFSMLVEMLNLRAARKKAAPVVLREKTPA